MQLDFCVLVAGGFEVGLALSKLYRASLDSFRLSHPFCVDLYVVENDTGFTPASRSAIPMNILCNFFSSDGRSLRSDVQGSRVADDLVLGSCFLVALRSIH